MKRHLATLSFCVLVCAPLACTSGRNHGVDSGDPWVDCSGARGMKLTCDSFGARAVNASRFDEEQQCFLPPAPIENYCSVPTGCPGGVGEVTCLIRDGRSYVFYAVYGEEYTSAAWHHGATETLHSTLTSAERTRCENMLAALRQGDPNDAGSNPVLPDSLGSVTIGPVCAPL